MLLTIPVLPIIVVFLYCIYRCYIYCKRDSHKCKRKLKYSRLPQDIESGLQNDGEHSFCPSEDNEQVSKPEVNHSQEIKLRDLQISNERRHVDSLNSSCTSVDNEDGQPPVTPLLVAEDVQEEHSEFIYNDNLTGLCLSPREISSDESNESLNQHQTPYPYFNKCLEVPKNELYNSIKLFITIKIPSNIRNFITTRLIPDFADQRLGYQFAVVMLLSESDYQNIEEIKYKPCEKGKPFINPLCSSMPQCENYCNYIVARRDPFLDCHAEEVIFGQPSKFTQLWYAYTLQHFPSPDYILIFSWILPCSKCTDLIIAALRKLRERPTYKEAKVFLAYVITWMKESPTEHESNIRKLTQNGVVVEKVIYDVFLPPQNIIIS